MFDKLHNSICRRQHEVLSYLYREMTPTETESFENHLAACGSCVDELADLSVSHLAVYEWRTNVFDKIPAPSLGLPLNTSVQSSAEGLLDRLRALLAGWPLGLKVGAGFAALMIVGVYAVFLTRPTASPELARSVEVVHTQLDGITGNKNSVVEAPPDRSTVSLTSVGGTLKERPPEQRSGPKVSRIKDTGPERQKPAAHHTGRAEFAAARNGAKTGQRSLRLNNFEEDEDTSLRLADLFEEVGSLY